MTTDVFEEFQQQLQTVSPEAALDYLVSRLREQQKYHELFEALKMQLRHRAGQPMVLQGGSDQLTGQQRDRYEDGLIEACREVGTALLRAGQVREAWMYLRPVGDTQAVIAQLDTLEPDDDQVDQIIEVTLHEGVDPPRGFRLLLEKYGTCNSITTFDAHAPALDTVSRRRIAGILVRHVYDELVTNVKGHIERHEGRAVDESNLRRLLVDRDWLTEDGNYHIDTSHLGSTVRFGRFLTDRDQLTLAHELTQYGEMLHENLQYAGEEPFVQLYPAHRKYFEALLGIGVQQALEYFRDRAETVDPHHEGTAAIETFVELLARTGQSQEAVRYALEKLPPGTHTRGIAPSLLELAEQANDFSELAQLFRDRGDLLGYATTLLQSSASENNV